MCKQFHLINSAYPIYLWHLIEPQNRMPAIKSSDNILNSQQKTQQTLDQTYIQVNDDRAIKSDIRNGSNSKLDDDDINQQQISVTSLVSPLVASAPQKDVS